MSGGAVLLVDDAAEDITASDRAAVGSADRVGNWLSELQATMWFRLVVVMEVLVAANAQGCGWSRCRSRRTPRKSLR